MTLKRNIKLQDPQAVLLSNPGENLLSKLSKIMPPAQLTPDPSTRSPYDPPHPPKRVFLEMITDSAEMAAAAAGVTAATRWADFGIPVCLAGMNVF